VAISFQQGALRSAVPPNPATAKGWSRTQADAYDRREAGHLFALASGIERPEPITGQAVALYLNHRILASPQFPGHYPKLGLAFSN